MLSDGILSLRLVGVGSLGVLDDLSKGQVWRRIFKGLTTGPGYLALGFYIPTSQTHRPF